ncbi:hypothetical protein R3P38DRAFT_3076433 [Favolaschia claudopus]|uniref:Uncharacterized protein n=1 Tax=Favolaschia claudopus TaxID=2862362 RepID=A0AAV9ZWL8_9AGAR
MSPTHLDDPYECLRSPAFLNLLPLLLSQAVFVENAQLPGRVRELFLAAVPELSNHTRAMMSRESIPRQMASLLYPLRQFLQFLTPAEQIQHRFLVPAPRKHEQTTQALPVDWTIPAPQLKEPGKAPVAITTPSVISPQAPQIPSLLTRPQPNIVRVYPNTVRGLSTLAARQPIPTRRFDSGRLPARLEQPSGAAQLSRPIAHRPPLHRPIMSHARAQAPVQRMNPVPHITHPHNDSPALLRPTLVEVGRPPRQRTCRVCLDTVVEVLIPPHPLHSSNRREDQGPTVRAGALECQQ